MLQSWELVRIGSKQPPSNIRTRNFFPSNITVGRFSSGSVASTMLTTGSSSGSDGNMEVHALLGQQRLEGDSREGSDA
jgi:hypothetical protein